MAMNMNIAQIQAMAADLGARTLGQVGIPGSPYVQYHQVLGGWRPAIPTREAPMLTSLCQSTCCVFLCSPQECLLYGLLTDGQ